MSSRNGGLRSRPASSPSAPSRQRRSTASQPRQAPPRPKPPRRRAQTTLTARAAVLAVALATVALAVALPFKIWLGQRGQIASLSEQTRTAQANLKRLSAEQKRWQDPAYIEQQARQRLHYVLPGHKTYIVYNKPAAPHRKSATDAAAGSHWPWYSQLWKSVQTAGQ